MSSPTDVIDLATVYLRIYFFGMPALLTYNFGAAILRAQGDTRRPLYFLFLSGVVNVVLNLFFVIVLHMDVAGVALATIISQYISAALVVWCLVREEGALRLELNKLGLQWSVIRRILQVGLPAGCREWCSPCLTWSSSRPSTPLMTQCWPPAPLPPPALRALSTPP